MLLVNYSNGSCNDNSSSRATPKKEIAAHAEKRKPELKSN